jgi:putative transposase
VTEMVSKVATKIVSELRAVLPETLVNSMAREAGAVKRQGKVKIYTFVWNLVLGFACGDKRTLAALRRSYERAARHTIEESAFYKRFSPELTVLLKRLLTYAFSGLVGSSRALGGHLAQFKDVMLTDSTVVRLHDLLAKKFPACRTNHTKAALKAHVVLSVSGEGGSSVKITPERDHDGPVFKVGPWVKDRLLLFDLGYFRYQLFDCIRRNGGFFLTRLKKNANPRIVAVNRLHRGRAVELVGQRLRDVIGGLDREVLDIEVEVEFPRRTYAGKSRHARQRLRIVGLRDVAAGEYHLYITNLPVDRLPAEDVGIIYSLRWQIELLFKELKTHFRLEDLPSRKPVVVEALLYAALLTLVASRRVLDIVRKRLREGADRAPAMRWAAIFISIAHDLLLAVTRRSPHARPDLRDVTRLLLHEAKDPNRKRHGLLRAVETGRRQVP